MDDYISDNEYESQKAWIIEKYECSQEEARIYMSYWLDGYPPGNALCRLGLQTLRFEKGYS